MTLFARLGIYPEEIQTAEEEQQTGGTGAGQVFYDAMV